MKFRAISCESNNQLKYEFKTEIKIADSGELNEVVLRYLIILLLCTFHIKLKSFRSEL